mgnify:CR=1 FL=1
MTLFDVYPLFDITPVSAKGSWLWDDRGQKYLDLYGGHAVISIGHSHPHYIKRMTDQLQKIAFYSNSVQNNLQRAFSEKLGEVSGYPDYQLFLCNSGAEANENALKVASFVTGRKKVIAFKKAFHGRTSGAVAASWNPTAAPIAAPIVCAMVLRVRIAAIGSSMFSRIRASRLPAGCPRSCSTAT